MKILILLASFFASQSSFAQIPIDCEGDWDNWSACTHACGNFGEQDRKFRVSQPARNGGTHCLHNNEEVQTRSCNTDQQCVISKVDCAGDWGPWSACDSVCGGTQVSSFNITTSPIDGIDYFKPPFPLKTAAVGCPVETTREQACPPSVNTADIAACLDASGESEGNKENTVNSVPEPSVLALFGAGLACIVGIGWVRRRRKS